MGPRRIEGVHSVANQRERQTSWGSRLVKDNRLALRFFASVHFKEFCFRPLEDVKPDENEQAFEMWKEMVRRADEENWTIERARRERGAILPKESSTPRLNFVSRQIRICFAARIGANFCGRMLYGKECAEECEVW